MLNHFRLSEAQPQRRDAAATYEMTLAESVHHAGLPALAPLAAVLHDPIRQGALKADVVSRLFGFDPFMSQYLLPLRLELAVEGGTFDHVVVWLAAGCGWHKHWFFCQGPKVTGPFGDNQ